MNVGDRVIIVRVNSPVRGPEKSWEWSHGIECTLKQLRPDDKTFEQFYFVEFDKSTNGYRQLYCHAVKAVFKEIKLPKELFEI